jgi:hypothetical protein
VRTDWKHPIKLLVTMTTFISGGSNARNQRAQQIQANPRSFRLLRRNRSTMGCDILNAGGVGPNGISGIDNPQALQSQLGSKNCFYGCTALRPGGQISVQRASDQLPPTFSGGSSR